MFLDPMRESPGDHYGLQHGRTGARLATKLETAFDSVSRRRGLLGRDHLEEGTALIIAPCHAIHTFFMRFPIDVLFLAKDGRVLKLSERLGPWRIAYALRARAVVECPEGAIGRCGIRVGDFLTPVPVQLPQ